MATDYTLERLCKEMDRLRKDPNTTDAELKAKNEEIEERLQICRGWEEKIDQLRHDTTEQDLDLYH